MLRDGTGKDACPTLRINWEIWVIGGNICKWLEMRRRDFFCLRDGLAKPGRKGPQRLPAGGIAVKVRRVFRSTDFPLRLGHTQVHVFARCFSNPIRLGSRKGRSDLAALCSRKKPLGSADFRVVGAAVRHTHQNHPGPKESTGIGCRATTRGKRSKLLVGDCYPVPFVPAAWQFAYGRPLATTGTSTTVERNPGEIAKLRLRLCGGQLRSGW